jgi:hypothetical protein
MRRRYYSIRKTHFWDFKNILFANQTGVQGQFSDGNLEAFAKSIGLNMTQFKACYRENASRMTICGAPMVWWVPMEQLLVLLLYRKIK